jgi:proteasome lid subunit RPN8/RPN11
MKAVLRKIALTNLVLSVTETYKHEALGVIFGKVEKDFIKIINAIPYQTAKRKFNEVDDSKKSKIVKKLAENSHVMIGDFHSHSDFKSGMHAKLSPQDIKDLKEGMTSIIIGIKKIGNKRKTLAANRKSDGKGISFSKNGYKYQIRGYHKTKAGEIKELRIDNKNFKNII